jgi:hypothetical protein
MNTRFAWAVLAVAGLAMGGMLVRASLAPRGGGCAAIALADDGAASKPASGPASAPTPAPVAEYYCPMHPNIIKSQPGNCPICGMPLVKRLKPASSPTGKFVNARCPIMGGAINPARVTDDLTREYKGQKVAFCCGGCPPEWDKLSPAEKDAKLKAVTGAK